MFETQIEQALESLCDVIDSKELSREQKDALSPTVLLLCLLSAVKELRV